MKALRKFYKDLKGNIALEAVIILPIFILIFAGIYDLSSLALAKNKLIRLAATIANDIAIQPSIGTASIQGIIGNSNIIMTPYSTTGAGFGTTISQVEPDTTVPCTAGSACQLIIKWQVTQTGSTTSGQPTGSVSKIGNAGAIPALPNGLTLTTGQSIIVAEAIYTYTPLLLQYIIGTPNLYSISIYVPRSASLDTLTPS